MEHVTEGDADGVAVAVKVAENEIDCVDVVEYVDVALSVAVMVAVPLTDAVIVKVTDKVPLGLNVTVSDALTVDVGDTVDTTVCDMDDELVALEEKLGDADGLGVVDWISWISPIDTYPAEFALFDTQMKR